MYQSLVLFVLSFSLLHNIQGFAPQGCLYKNRRALCDFQEWIPPVDINEFGPEPLYYFGLININGSIPAGVFCGLNRPLTNSGTIMHLFCSPDGSTSFSRDTFTQNLHWVVNLMVDKCILKNGLPSRLFENLKNLNYLTITGEGSEIEGLVAHDSLTGLGNLQQMTIRATVKNGRLPPGLFEGLKNITYIDLRYGELNVVPPDWFKGLVRLEKIYLSENNIHTLAKGLFDGLRSLAYVELNNNPWTCSCELVWLHAWSNITDGGICQRPSVVENMMLEQALGLLNCSTSTSTVLSTFAYMATEITGTPMSSVTSFEANDSYYECRDPTRTSTKPMPDISATFRNILTITPAGPKKTMESSVLTTSISITISSASCRASTTDGLEITNSVLSLSPVLSARSTFKQTFPFTTKDPVSLNNRNNHNDLHRNTVLISAACALTVLLVVAVVLYRNKYFVSVNSVNRVNNGEEGRHDPDHLDRQTATSDGV